MMKASKGGVVSVLLSIMAIIYLAWSQIALYKYQKALEIERTRIYSIADHLELWKEISIKHDGYLNLEELGRDQRNINITQIKRKDGTFLADDDMFYVMFYDELDSRRKSELNRFFSDLVLGNYFYVITDKNGKIKEMFWDKP